jgi:hypothetical protein
VPRRRLPPVMVGVTVSGSLVLSFRTRILGPASSLTAAAPASLGLDSNDLLSTAFTVTHKSARDGREPKKVMSILGFHYWSVVGFLPMGLVRQSVQSLPHKKTVG